LNWQLAHRPDLTNLTEPNFQKKKKKKKKKKRKKKKTNL
jgi:hypothetical protein